jgi:hypothetical protein
VIEGRGRGKGKGGGKGKKKDSDESSDEDPDLEAMWQRVIAEDRGPNALDPSVLPELKEWDPKKCVDHFFMVLEGKRRTGKSTFAKWFLQYHSDDFSIVWCMTNTKSSGYW